MRFTMTILGFAVLLLPAPGYADLPFLIVDQDARELTLKTVAVYNQVATAKKYDIEVTAVSLKDLLLRLRDIEGKLHELDQSPTEQRIAQDAIFFRALAFLHAWATWSYLVTDESVHRVGNAVAQASDDDIEHTRRILIGWQKDSCLWSLLVIYNDIGKTYPKETDPLRHILSSGSFADIPAYWSYTQPWRDTEDRGTVAHANFVPSTTTLFGAYGDPPNHPKENRHILSIWGLVNLQLDTWHQLSSSAVPAPSSTLLTASGNKTSVLAANLMKLDSLSDWLQGFNNLTFSAGPWSQGWTPLVQRTQRIGQFLRFRQKYSDPKDLAVLVEAIGASIRSGFNLKREGLSDIDQLLIPSATWIQNERLYDAEVWLRYVMLLGYQQMPTVAVREPIQGQQDRIEMRLANIWENTLNKNLDGPPSFGAPEPNTLIPNSSIGITPFLRWNSKPVKHSATNFLDQLSRATYAYLQAEDQRITKQDVRADILATTNSPALEQRMTSYQEAAEKLQSIDNALASLLSVNAIEWGNSTSPVEQQFLPEDLRVLRARLGTDMRLYKTLSEAYTLVRNGPQHADVLSGAPASPSIAFAPGSAFSLPAKSFAEYQREFDEAIRRFDEGQAEEAAVIIDLEHRLSQALRALKAARHDRIAGALSETIAHHASKALEYRKRAALLRDQIIELEKEIREANLQGSRNTMGAREKASELRSRMVLLAEARMEALRQAYQQAERLIPAAQEQLATLQGKLREAANDKRQESIFSTIKAIVSVVSIALAPFTGGATLTALPEVVRGIDAIDQIHKIGFDDPLQAVVQLSTAASGLAQQLNLSGIPDEGLKKSLSEAQSFLNRTKEFGTLTNEAKQLIQGLKNQPSVAAQYGAAIANGISIAIAKNGAALNAQIVGTVAVLRDTELASGIAAFLATGGMIKARLGEEQNRFTTLLGLEDQRMRAGLQVALREASTLLPTEVTGLEDTRARFESAKGALMSRLDGVSHEKRKVFVEILAQGGSFVQKADGTVDAVMNTPLTTSAAFVARLQAEANSTLLTEIEGVRSKLEKRMIAWNEKTDNLSHGGNADAYDALASEVRDAIPTVTQDLDELKRKITIEEGKLEEARLEAEIGKYDAEAAKWFLKAAEKNSDQVHLLKSEAALNGMSVEEDYQAAIRAVEQAEHLSSASRLREEMAQAEYDRVFFDCIMRGLSPGSKTANLQTGLLNGASVIGLLNIPANRSSVDLEHKIRRITGPAFGMIQWLALLTPGAESVPLNAQEEYLALLDWTAKLTREDKITPSDPFLSGVSKYKDHYRKMTRNSRGATRLHSRYITKDPLVLDNFSWRPVDKDPSSFLLPLSRRDLRADYLGQWSKWAVARFDFAIQITDGERDHASYAGRYKFDACPVADFYVVTNLAYLIRDRDTRLSTMTMDVNELSFLLIPPSVSRSNLDSVSFGASKDAWEEPVGKPRKISPDWDARSGDDKLDLLLKDNDVDLEVVPALGLWTFYILHEPAGQMSPSQLKTFLKELGSTLQLDLRLGSISVQNGAPCARH